MMRFISEKQVNLSANNISKKKYSTSKQINQSKIIPDIPKQEINNSSTALRSLKKINDYKQMIKGRVSVLQIHQQKNDFRAFLNEQKYQFHQHMKQQMNKERQEKDLYHKHLLKKLDQARNNAKTHRRMHESNLKKAKDEIYNSNKYDYMEKKQKSISIQKNINKFIQQTKEINKSRYLMVKQDQKTIINNIKKFQNEKKLEIKSRDWQQIEKVNRVKEERKRQIQQLAQLQLYMLQKQARSKMTSQESERKLMLLLKGGNKNVSTSHTTKLPAINPEEKKQHTDPDIFVI